MNQILKVLWCFSLSLVLLGLEERKVHVGMASAHCCPQAGSLGHLQASGDHSAREGSRAASARKESQCGAVTQPPVVHHTSPKCLCSRSYLQGGHYCQTVMLVFVSWMLLDLFQELRFPHSPHHTILIPSSLGITGSQVWSGECIWWWSPGDTNTWHVQVF